MKILNDKEKELLEKLQNASRHSNYFTLTLKINDVELEERVFSADKFSMETISETRTHFLFNDIIRQILKTYSEQEEKNQEEKKKQQMDKMWDEVTKKKGKED